MKRNGRGKKYKKIEEMQFGKLLNNGLTLASIFMIIYFYIGSNMDDKSITILPYYIPSIPLKYTKSRQFAYLELKDNYE